MIKIIFAKKKDIRGILSVQKSVLIKNLKTKDVKKGGFLVYPISAKQLKEVLDDARNIVLCAKDNNKIVGYVLSYDLNNWIKYKPEWIEKIKIKNRIKAIFNEKKVIYLRHIARKKNYSGVGTRLLKYFINLLRKKKVDYIICEILEKYPKNKRSVQFFSKFGFKRVGSITYNDGLIWGVYLLKL
jgi:ribosomal protein S18 acetylase RimI-like enzyme